jgi:hypothetical protein
LTSSWLVTLISSHAFVSFVLRQQHPLPFSSVRVDKTLRHVFKATLSGFHVTFHEVLVIICSTVNTKIIMYLSQLFQDTLGPCVMIATLDMGVDMPIY